MSAHIDLLGCEYLGGCPTLGSRVLNKVELHFDNDGLTVAIAPQGLFTPAAAHPVLVLAWQEITLLATTTRPRATKPASMRLTHAVMNVFTMRLDLPDELAIGVSTWTMTVGVRVPAAQLTEDLRDLLGRLDGPAPQVTTG
ncbi:MAG: hypothetical protein M3083_03480 [Actinomycetota bacterium]|nr:hypothetical protein [Actinomycetota bacterium]MDQ6947857.1 hypothetical protein [Actinomycetota bacterium]